jgi:hypothetical protein
MMAITTTEEEEACSTLYLPDDIWECIFKFFNGDHRTFKSLSVVSKQFLSITNRLRFPITVYEINNLPSPLQKIHQSQFP